MTAREGRTPVLAAVVGACATAGCGAPQACDGDGCPCPEERRLEDDRCCTGWSEIAGDVCVLRPLSMPKVVGEPGAEDLSVRVGGDGSWVATWITGPENTADLVIAEEVADDGSVTFHRPGRGLEGSSTRPALVVGVAARALVAWTERTTSHEAVYVAERDEDGWWTWPIDGQSLSLPPTARDPRPFIAPSGETAVVWNQGTTDGFGVAVATRAPREDGAFARPTDHDDVLSPPIGETFAPSLAIAANGDALVSWLQGTGGPAMVYVSERDRVDGTFSRPDVEAFISPAGAPVDTQDGSPPIAALHDRGAGVVVWTQADGRGAVPVYLALRDGFGTWTLPADPDASFSVAVGQARDTFASFGPDGDLTVIWTHDTGEGPAILLAHRTRTEEWTFEGRSPLQISTPGATARNARLAYGPDGAAALVWEERTDGPWQVALRRREPDGIWSSIERVSLSLEEDATAPSVSIGPDGRTVIGYLQGPSLLRRVHIVETSRR